jgi:Fe-S oxidoreductase
MEKIQGNDKTKCTLCGLCKTSCPTFKILLDEAVSPRGKATLLKRDFPSKHFYLCTMCKACEHSCILKDIDLMEKIRDYRKELVDLGMSSDANKRMIENIRQTGNALGIVEKGKKIELFCC